MTSSLPPDLRPSPYRFLTHVPTNTAVLADLHLGQEETLTREGIFMPANQEVTRRWTQLLVAKPSRIIIAGDLFDVSVPTDLAIETCRQMFRQASCPITLIPGNHDPEPARLSQLLEGLATIAPFVRLGTHNISHGHDLTLQEMQDHHPTGSWIVGHQHPAVILATRVQRAKMACFCVCEMPGIPAGLILLPAFSPGPLGSNLLARGNWLLPVPRPADDRMQILGIIETRDGDDSRSQVLPFGPLSGLATSAAG